MSKTLAIGRIDGVQEPSLNCPSMNELGQVEKTSRNLGPDDSGKVPDKSADGSPIGSCQEKELQVAFHAGDVDQKIHRTSVHALKGESHLMVEKISHLDEGSALVLVMSRPASFKNTTMACAPPLNEELELVKSTALKELKDYKPCTFSLFAELQSSGDARGVKVKAYAENYSEFAEGSSGDIHLHLDDWDCPSFLRVTAKTDVALIRFMEWMKNQFPDLGIRDLNLGTSNFESDTNSYWPALT